MGEARQRRLSASCGAQDHSEEGGGKDNGARADICQAIQARNSLRFPALYRSCSSQTAASRVRTAAKGGMAGLTLRSTPSQTFAGQVQTRHGVDERCQGGLEIQTAETNSQQGELLPGNSALSFGVRDDCQGRSRLGRFCLRLPFHPPSAERLSVRVLLIRSNVRQVKQGKARRQRKDVNEAETASATMGGPESYHKRDLNFECSFHGPNCRHNSM